MKVKVNTTEIVKIGKEEREFPISFEAEVEGTERMEQRIEVYSILKNAALGFGEYEIVVLG